MQGGILSRGQSDSRSPGSELSTARGQEMDHRAGDNTLGSKGVMRQAECRKAVGAAGLYQSAFIHRISSSSLVVD